MLYHVVAVANEGVIGKDNQLPWHFSSDLKFFKSLTMGHTIIMGRKTFESIGKPLPGRTNFVLTQSSAAFSGVQTFDSVDQALKAVRTEHAFIIGGAQIFKTTLPLVDGIYMSRIHADFAGDVFYPTIPKYFEAKPHSTLQDNPKIEVIFYNRTL